MGFLDHAVCFVRVGARVCVCMCVCVCVCEHFCVFVCVCVLASESALPWRGHNQVIPTHMSHPASSGPTGLI